MKKLEMRQRVVSVRGVGYRLAGAEECGNLADGENDREADADGLR